ncbi:MAG: protein translocase SEC61 complex subunit gamma [Nanoarchaeota archaeon]
MDDLVVKPSFWTRTKRFVRECVRVVTITKKPDKQEFSTIVKVTSLGMLIIGAAGFIIQMIRQVLFR